MAVDRRAFRPGPSVLLVLVLVLVAGCRLDIETEISVRPDGSGTAAVALLFDPSLAAELDRLGVDSAGDIVAAAGRAPGWGAREQRGSDGSLAVTLHRGVDDPGELQEAFRALASGLRDEDPALLVDLDVTVGDDGEVELRGDAGLRPPATVGARIDGDPVGPSGQDLAALVGRTVFPRLVVTLPGPVRAHDADRVDGRRLEWDLPVGETRTVTARSDAPSDVPAIEIAIVVVGLGVIAAGLWGWRRRYR